MAAQLIIHCLGLEGLTITVFGADHSIPLTTDVIRVTTILGPSIEYTIPQLPVAYNTTDLHGNLTISDSLGKTLYRLRVHSITQPPAVRHPQPTSQIADSLGSERRSLSTSTPPSHRTAETPLTSRSRKASNEQNNCPNGSSDLEAVVETPDGMSSFVLLCKAI